MTEIEIKSLKTQIELLKGIEQDNNMILHTIRTTTSQVLSDVIKPKTQLKQNQTTVELTIEEFTKIHSHLVRLSSEEELCQINSWIEKHIDSKKDKRKTLSMLS